MAGTPVRRERLKEAKAGEEQARTELQAVRMALIAKGLDPADFGAAALAEPPTLTAYSELLPRQVSRLASEGKSIEEIRVMLGYSEAQERDWVDQYVDFKAALVRVRAREEAFWQGQARHLASIGDRAGFTAVSALIDRRFNSNNARGDGADLVVIHVHKPLAQRTGDES